MVKKAKDEAWQTKYDLDKEEHLQKHNTELHIATIKPNIGHWPWSSYKNRAVETAVARLGIGHTELYESLFRFRQTNDPNCRTCHTPETVTHYLLVCRRFTD